MPFAVLASNTKIKKVTKFSAFEIMFGRTCEVVPLLNLSKSHSTYPTEQSSEDESIHHDSLSLSDPYAIEIETIDDIGHEMKFIRQQNESEVRLNIKVEQIRSETIHRFFSLNCFCKKCLHNRCSMMIYN